MPQRMTRLSGARPEALAQTAFVTLRADLRSGGPLTTSRRLVAGDLARRLGVSRTPVREALDRLARLGYLTALEGGGYECRRYRYRDVRDVFELRRLLEPYAAELASRGEPGAVAASGDGAFSVQVARASGNRVLTHVVELLAERVAALWVDSPSATAVERPSPARRGAGEGERAAVTAAIDGHDAVAARERMRRHIESEEVALLRARGVPDQHEPQAAGPA